MVMKVVRDKSLREIRIFLFFDGHSEVSGAGSARQTVIPNEGEFLAGQGSRWKLNGQELAGKEIHDGLIRGRCGLQIKRRDFLRLLDSLSDCEWRISNPST